MKVPANEANRVTDDHPADSARAMNRWLLDALDHVATVGIVQPGEQDGDGPLGLFAQAGQALFRIAPFDGGAFFRLDQAGTDFPMVWHEPAGRGSQFAAEIEAQVARGVFAWALQNNHPVLVPGVTFDGTAILHALATRSGPIAFGLILLAWISA